MSYIITGCEEQHFQIRTAIVSHMRTISHFLNGFGQEFIIYMGRERIQRCIALSKRTAL